MTTPFDYRRTPAGIRNIDEQGKEVTGDFVSSFRNLSGGAGRGLPPTLRPFYADQFPQAGMMSVQRHLDNKKTPVSVEVASQLPIHSPRFTIDRAQQLSALHGNKKWREGGRDAPARGPGRTLHAPVSGQLSPSESQAYLLGDMTPQDAYDYDVELDARGNAVVLDEEGQFAPLVTYWPFDRDEHGQIRYREDTAAPMSPEGAISGERTLSESERFGRPLPHPISGSGDWVLMQGEGKDPIPIPMRSTFEGQLGISTPKGVSFPKGVDLNRIVRRSASLQDLGSILWKELHDSLDTHTEGQFTEHDFFLFAHMMDEELSKEDDLTTRVPTRGSPMTDEEREARRKVLDYPITGWEGGLSPSAMRGSDLLVAAGAKPRSRSSSPVSWVDKMPGPSFNTPSDMCHAGTSMRDVEGSVCEDCNVHYEGRYGSPVVQAAMQRRYDKMMEDPKTWAEAMIRLLPEYARMTSDKGNKMPVSLISDYPDIDDRQHYMRWHDSGDMQGPQHFGLLTDIARATPGINHWIPTKEPTFLREFLRAGGEIPDNMVVRVSMPMKGQDVAGMGSLLDDHPRVLTSTVGRSQVDPNHQGYVCPASKKGSGGCIDEDCNACWRTDFDNIDYQWQEKGQKGREFAFDDLAPFIQRQYEQLNPPIPTDPEGFQAFTQTPEGQAAIDHLLRRN